MKDATFDAVALAELRAKGVTCRSCEHWSEQGCKIERPSFPRVCRRYEYEPGSDETVQPDE